jgi:hypothetical protein
MRSDAMVAELVSSQNVFAGPLLATQKRLSAQLPQAADAAAQRSILSSVRLIFRIFFSLNGPGLTPVSAACIMAALMGGCWRSHRRGSVFYQIIITILPHDLLASYVMRRSTHPRALLLTTSHLCMSSLHLSRSPVLQLMETQLDDWMAEFHTYLTMPDIPGLAESDTSKESITDAVRSAVCANINLVR